MDIIDIQGVECKIPKVGWIYDWKLGKEVYVGVIRRSKDFEGCYWEVDVRWGKYRDWVIEERKMRERNPKFVHEELRKFVDDCWRYRIGGQWFMNNRVPTYITGVHWYFLSCYRMDVGLPRYKEIDKEYFYMWDKVVRDNNLFGMVELTKRRNGKSYKGGS